MLDEKEKTLTIPGYAIEDEVGKGGMATVYLAIQNSLRRRVALKVMSPALTNDKNFADRFLKEGQIVAQLDHPQIVTVFDFGTHHHLYYLSMEYLPGGTLEQRIREGLSSVHAAQIIKTIAEALGYAHSQGVLHRDIKPHNILFRRDGRPVLTDFGIARFIDDNVHLTAPGLTVGSPSYMSPERVSGKSIDARSDLYSMGVVFYQMLTGELPYQAESPISVAIKHCSEPLPKLPTECVRFQSILDKLLAKEPEDRYPNAEAFVTALDDFDSQQYTINISQSLPTKHPKKSFIHGYKTSLLASGVVLALAVGTYFVVDSPFSSQHDSSIIDLRALPPVVENRNAIAARYEDFALETLAEGNLQQSFALINIGLESVPNDARLLVLQERVENILTANGLLKEAQQLERQGDLAESLSKIQEGLRLAPNYPELVALHKQVTNLQLAETRLQEAQQLQQQGDLAESLSKIQEGLKAVADHSALVKLGEKVQTQLTNQTKAHELLQQAQQQFQDHAYEESLTSVEKGLQHVLDHAELLALRDKIQGQIKLEQEVDERVKQVQELEQKGALVEALVVLDGGQKRVSDHPKILALRDRIGSALARQQEINGLLQQAQQHYQDGNLQDSLYSIAQGLKISPQQTDLLALQEEVQAQREQQQAELAETQRRQQEADDLLQQAEDEYQAGELAKSLQTIKEGLEEVANHADLRTLRATVESALARQQEINGLLQQAQQHYQDGNLQDSLDSIAQGLKISPQQTDLLALQEEVQAQREQQQAELAETQRRQQEADDLLQQAKAHFQNGEFEKTLVAIEAGLDQVSDHPDLRALRDKVQTALTNQQEADVFLQQAKQVWQKGELEKSLALIQEGLLLVPEQPDLVLLQKRIEQQLATQNEVAELFKNCQRYAAFNALDLEEMAPAVACYRTVLERQPNHPKARQALQKLTDHYVRLADQALTKGAEKQAENYLSAFADLNLTHSQLTSLKERLKILTEASLQANTANQLAELLRECAAHLQADRLTTGQGGTALACYNQVLREDPNNKDAQNGLEQIASKYASWAASALSRNDDSRAKQHLQRLQQVDPQHPRLAMLRNDLQTLQETRQRQTEAAQRQAEEAERQQQLRQAAARQQRERIDLLLSQAQQRYANGAFRESLALVDQGLELAPDHNRLQTLRQEIQAKLVEAAKPKQPPESLSSEDDENTRSRKRIFGTF